MRIATADLSGQSLMCGNCEEIVSIIMYLLIKYAYPLNADFGKFTIHYVMKIPAGRIPFSICKAITFREGGQDLSVYSLVDHYVGLKGEEYGKYEITRISIRIYYLECQSKEPRHLSEDQIASLIGGSMNSEAVVEHQEARKIDHRKSQYPKHITALNPTRKERMPFIVADTETVLINDIHVPYAVGFLVVEPGDALSSERSYSIETYFSEDYPVQIYETIHKRSNKMLYDFIERIEVVVRRNPSIQTVYFHNLSRFDGILLLKYFATYDEKYRFKPLLRNSRLYELVIYRGRNMLFRLRDSLMLLPERLNYLAENLCPQLGAKGCIPHDEVQESNLIPLRFQLRRMIGPNPLYRLASFPVRASSQNLDSHGSLGKRSYVANLLFSSYP
nr:RNA polymerase [Ipomoea batatas]